MNQILVSKKLYITPDMKKKKKVFKYEFIVSVFLLCALTSYAIYAEYDRNKSEEVSKEILSSIEFKSTQVKSVLPNINTKAVKTENDTIVVILNEALEGVEKEKGVSINDIMVEVPVDASKDIPEEQKLTASDGTVYYTIGTINIPKINVNYPILSTTSVELLKISPCKFWGANPNQVGNLCIVGHNYRNSLFFSKVPTLEIGDSIEITDLSGKKVTYIIYDKYIIDPSDVACTSQLTQGKREVTLITCTNDSKQRYVIKSREDI